MQYNIILINKNNIIFTKTKRCVFRKCKVALFNKHKSSYNSNIHISNMNNYLLYLIMFIHMYYFIIYKL